MSWSLSEALTGLDTLARRLRRDCPWDREQTAKTIVPHTVEEAYEVADAAMADDGAKLLDELGDLLYQVDFLALLLEERATAISRRSRRRSTRSSFGAIHMSSAARRSRPPAPSVRAGSR